jgi:hypothetical protein
MLVICVSVVHCNIILEFEMVTGLVTVDGTMKGSLDPRLVLGFHYNGTN